MSKPLWIFFNVLREKSSQTITVDQYFDFFTAFNELDLSHIGNMELLRDFSKIFWLNNDSFEEEYNRLFKGYTSDLKLEELILHREVSHTPNASNASDTDTSYPINVDDKSGNIGTDKIEKKPRAPEKEQSVSSDKEILADFELLIGDGKSKVRASRRSYQCHQFKLDDQSIIPFKPRYLTQRMRRLVESPSIEWTDNLDYKLMIEEFSQNRFIEEIKYEKKETSHSHVVLLSDHWGSMLAYEYFEKQISQSMLSIPGCRFEHYTFKNLPEYDPKTNGYDLLKLGSGEINTESLNTKWKENTWILLLSDGGGLSGMVNRGRMRASFQFWQYLKSKTNHVHWINPVSKKHRKGTTAERLNLSIPMLFPIQSELNVFFNKV